MWSDNVVSVWRNYLHANDGMDGEVIYLPSHRLLFRLTLEDEAAKVDISLIIGIERDRKATMLDLVASLNLYVFFYFSILKYRAAVRSSW